LGESVVPRAWDANAAARSALQISAIAWFLPALIGQWFFAYHVAAVYLATAFTGKLAAWNKVLFVGFVSGDLVGNVALVAHMFIAFVITIGGTLQLIPQIRHFAPAFHRWNGRVYIGLAFVTSLAALFMIWTRNTFIALRHAIACRIEVHRRWALRTFIVVSGVWFTRVIYAFLDRVPGPTPGVLDDMSGPTNIVIGFASYLLPLAVLEAYLLAKRHPSVSGKIATAALLLAAAVATSVGVHGTVTKWLS
jgi:hypothetical protein